MVVKKKRTRKNVTCAECGHDAKILASSVEKDGPTVWECPDCGATNQLEK